MDILNILVSTGLTGVVLMILWHFVKNWMEDRDAGHEANRKAINSLSTEVTQLKSSFSYTAQEAMKPAKS